MIESKPHVKLVLGPIIGQVTHNSARVLIELEYSEEISCTLTSSTGKTIVARTLPAKTRPTVFKFTELEPKTRYTVSLEHVPEVKGGFSTLREETDNSGNLRVGIVSCNNMEIGFGKDPKQDLWSDLAAKVKENSFDYVFHIGDQCYMDMGEPSQDQDQPYQQCKFILDTTPKELWNTKVPEILTILKNEYRKNWSHPSLAYVLANVPNLTVLDDHEVMDDWGHIKDSYSADTLKTADGFFGQFARQVYYEYQRQLRDDIDWSNLAKLGCEYHDHIVHGVGVAFLDYRGSRSWFREEDVEKTQLGRKQTDWLYNLFSPQGRFSKVNSTLLISPLPVVYFSHIPMKLAGLYDNDAKEHWTHDNLDEMIELFEVLRKWKSQQKGREVTIVSGDVHIGGHTDIFYKDQGIFKQFTSSAINGTVPTRKEQLVLRFMQEVSGELKKDYTFEHHDWTRFNNYGIVKVENRQGKSIVECRLVKGESEGIVMEKKTLNNVVYENKSCMCNTF